MTEASATFVIPTRRLILRPWRSEEAVIMREMWLERDPRVPSHRRIDANGQPSVAVVRDRLLQPRPPLGLLAAQDRRTGDVLGYCGLVSTDHAQPEEPEIAFEFLRRTWGHGLATEAAEAVIDWACENGIERIWATVWDWNLASRRVLEKLGFAMHEPARVEPEDSTTLCYVLTFHS